VAIELADEHDPHMVVGALLDVIGCTLADSRRGWHCQGGEVITCTYPTDSGFDLELQLTINFK